jgi:hypothetical protein
MGSWIYETNPENSARFSIGEKGNHPLVFIGINPSRATPEKLDATLTRSRRFATLMGFDGWIMFNLYPQRSTLPSGVHKRCNRVLNERNFSIIQKTLAEYTDFSVCAAWGNLIESRPFLKTNLVHLLKAIPEDKPWIRLGSPTLRKHPRHPSRLGYNTRPQPFYIHEYLNIWLT